MIGNYELVYYVAQKCVNYRDTGVSKNCVDLKNVNPIAFLLSVYSN